MADAARQLGLAPSTLHRWVNDGFIPGEQLTPGAPWRIRMTGELRALFTDDAPPAGSPSAKPSAPMVSPARPCCSVSSAASCRPSTSAPDGRKACVSSCHPPKMACSDSHDQQRRQCDDHAITAWKSRLSAWPSASPAAMAALSQGGQERGLAPQCCNRCG